VGKSGVIAVQQAYLAPSTALAMAAQAIRSGKFLWPDTLLEGFIDRRLDPVGDCPNRGVLEFVAPPSHASSPPTRSSADGLAMRSKAI